LLKMTRSLLTGMTFLVKTLVKDDPLFIDRNDLPGAKSC